MRIQEIMGILREYFLLALLALIVLGIIIFIGYFIVYRKLFKGKKGIPINKLFFGGLFIGYIIMVIGVTFLNRGPSFQGGMNLSLFSTYKEAWHNFSIRHWQFVILNIIMFVPFGILFPLLHSRFQRAIWAIGAALLFTISIESIQLVTAYGNFVLDDLFNNLLGAIIGYGIIIGLITLKSKGIIHSVKYFTPLFLVVISFVSIFTYYHFKEFGNLSIVPLYKANMSEAKITVDKDLNDNGTEVSIYKAPSYTKTAADEFVVDFFEKKNVDSSNMDVIYYQHEGVYWIREGSSHNIWFNFLDGSYSYSDFSYFDEDIELKDVDEEILLENLIQLGIHIPQDASFQKNDTGSYEWIVDKKLIENQLIDGNLGVSYYNDDTVKVIDNQLITYEKVRDVQIKSEQEAYKEILEGNFQHYSENKMIESIHIHRVELTYRLDSKGYYQPVYAFYSTVNGIEHIILIPAM
ncbi:VanZ family protein [Evansella cellulosilytica]|uniref:VanZ family protein n=1 Tax=Evansella cellulosilytica (strain ATCC 21833 / DSM 2522 / FERM P-1141 / JCM 9156 / N-4) TaxID=649639 RepID=E6TZ06_EVAC2|nr:VanZ family protein [Evansella cellulosilytica]ADU32449.1 VanZ family protein [Evansella cellulosilytica DSM 2522]